jgi:hypothetical protein
LHPLSPRGKLVHWGLEGLEASSRLIKQAQRVNDKVVLKDHLYRVAAAETTTVHLRATAEAYPAICKWLSPDDEPSFKHGALRLNDPCQVVHVPTYLKSLFVLCQELAASNGHLLTWSIDVYNNDKERNYDTVILACGAGLFHDKMLALDDFPVQLVRGQSVELKLAAQTSTTTLTNNNNNALLCGKYVSPVPED